MSDNRVNYISIPIELRACPVLSHNEREIIAHIINVSNKFVAHDGCTLSNEEIAYQHRVSKDAVTKALTKARQLGFITHENMETVKYKMDKLGICSYATKRTLQMRITPEWIIMGDLWNMAFYNKERNKAAYGCILQVEREIKKSGKIDRENILEIIGKALEDHGFVAVDERTETPTPPHKFLRPPSEKIYPFTIRVKFTREKGSEDIPSSHIEPSPTKQKKSETKPSPSQRNGKNLPHLLAQQLAAIIQKERKVKITPSKLASWSKDIERMQRLDGIDYKRIRRALNWYADHIGDEYVPVIWAGSSLREKFLRLEDAIERNSRSSRPKGANRTGLNMNYEDEYYDEELQV